MGDTRQLQFIPSTPWKKQDHITVDAKHAARYFTTRTATKKYPENIQTQQVNFL